MTDRPTGDAAARPISNSMSAPLKVPGGVILIPSGVSSLTHVSLPGQVSEYASRWFTHTELLPVAEHPLDSASWDNKSPDNGAVGPQRLTAGFHVISWIAVIEFALVCCSTGCWDNFRKMHTARPSLDVIQLRWLSGPSGRASIRTGAR